MVDKLYISVSNLHLLVHAVALYDAYQLKQTMKAWKDYTSTNKQIDQVHRAYSLKRYIRRWYTVMFRKLAIEVRHGRVSNRRAYWSKYESFRLWFLYKKIVSYRRMVLWKNVRKRLYVLRFSADHRLITRRQILRAEMVNS